MTLNAAKKLIESLDSNIDDENVGNPHFGGVGVAVFPLTRDGFESINVVDSNRKTAFIDGGNQEIIGAANFSIHLNRVCFCIWEGSERVSECSILKRVDYFSLTYSTIEKGEITYTTKLVPLAGGETILPDEVDLAFSSLDRSLMIGDRRANISGVGSIARRFSELALAREVVENELREGDLLVLDGTLQSAFKNEVKYLNQLTKAAQDKGIILAGLSKTSNLFTDTGYSLLGAIDKLASENQIKGEWYYPIADIARNHVTILGVKLNASSDRIFRFEVQREQFLSLGEHAVNEFLSQLVKNSIDFTFPGYPYGLIDVDRSARVSASERDHHRAILFSEMASTNKWEKFYRHIKCVDAHDLLNNLG
ncbi:MAG: DNA double-strand break repair nuclease NurA [Halobacteriota archaeon]